MRTIWFRFFVLCLAACLTFTGCTAGTVQTDTETSADTKVISDSDLAESETDDWQDSDMESVGVEATQDDYYWDEEKGFFVASVGNGDKIYREKDGTVLKIDYSFRADLTFADVTEGGAFYLFARSEFNRFVRFGITATSDSTFELFSDYANMGEVTNRITHLEDVPCEPSARMGLIVYGDSVAMLWNDEVIYSRTVEGIAESQLVVSEVGGMTVSLGNICAENDSAKVDTLYQNACENYYGPIIGKISNLEQGFEKCREDRKGGIVTIAQKSTDQDAPIFNLYSEGNLLEGDSWAVRGTIRTETVAGKAGKVRFYCYQDDANYAVLAINRKVGGSNGIWRHIRVDGVRTPKSANENVSNTFADTKDWLADFAVVYDEGRFMIYIKEPGEEFELMTEYEVTWGACSLRVEIPSYADVTFSDMEITQRKNEVGKMLEDLNKANDTAVQALKVLFVGNSATYVNELPETLQKLATAAGYAMRVDSVTKGGYTLAQHAASDALLEKIAKGGYDVVFLQENGDAVYVPENNHPSREAHEKLAKAIKEAGAQTYLYIRPPSGKEKGNGDNSFTQCIRYDEFFSDISEKIGAENAYVNRAFAYAIKNCNFGLWGSDNAHTSVHGGYLAVCVFFATLFQTSSTVLDVGALPAEDAQVLQQIADKIVLEDVVPW